MQNVYDNPDFFSGYQELRQKSLGFNDILEQPALRSLVGSAMDKALLDIGCGFGDFCRYAAQECAKSITGIDPSERMLAQAKRLTLEPSIDYQCVPVEIASFASGQFDLIVSSLVFHYVKDFESVAKKICRWLAPGGRMIFSVEHPICTANADSKMGEDEVGVYFPVRAYRDEALFLQNWLIKGVEKYHRTVSSYLNIIIKSGFLIKEVVEPMPTAEQIKAHPHLKMHAIRPPLLLISAEKGSTP